MSDRSSPYYPQRAGWTRSVYRAAYRLRRHLHLEHLQLPGFAIKINVRRMAACLAIPGYTFCDVGWRRLGRAIMLSWCVAACAFLAWLGHVTANVAFGLMMSMHVSSILHFLNRVSPAPLLKRLALSLMVLFVVGLLIYRSGLGWLQNHLFIPVERNGKVYVVNRAAPVNALQRGDFVACRFEGSGYRIRIRSGYILDRVLALPGDEVRFTDTDFQVNGIADKRLPFMPAAGSLVLDEKTWLIWPSLHTVMRNNAAENDIAAAVLNMAQVHREQMIGKPFQRWFWRDQSP